MREIRALLIQHATSDCQPAAYLGMAVMANGTVHIDALHIEPEHALAMLAHFDEVRQTLEDFAAAHSHFGRTAQVIPFRPST